MRRHRIKEHENFLALRFPPLSINDLSSSSSFTSSVRWLGFEEQDDDEQEYDLVHGPMHAKRRNGALQSRGVQSK